MYTVKLKTRISPDHVVTLKVPADFPTGEVELVIVATPAEHQPRPDKHPDDWQSIPLSDADLAILDDFESFRQEHPIRFHQMDDIL
jgi:hypothetical protein